MIIVDVHILEGCVQQERGSRNRVVVLKFISRRVKELKSRVRCCHIDLSQSAKLIKQQVQSIEEAEHVKDVTQAETADKNRRSVLRLLHDQLTCLQSANAGTRVNMTQKLTTIKNEVLNMSLSVSEIEDLIEVESNGKKRKSVLKFLGAQVKKRKKVH